MKILCVSDSHGDLGALYDVVDENLDNFHLLLHMGDGADEVSQLPSLFPKIEYAAVRGNCDGYSDLPTTRTMIYRGVKILMTHGHLFGVKRDLEELARYGKEQGAELVLFGHSHRATLKRIKGVTLFNPGSLCERRTGVGQSTYGIVDISDRGVIDCKIMEVQ